MKSKTGAGLRQGILIFVILSVIPVSGVTFTPNDDQNIANASKAGNDNKLKELLTSKSEKDVSVEEKRTSEFLLHLLTNGTQDALEDDLNQLLELDGEEGRERTDEEWQKLIPLLKKVMEKCGNDSDACPALEDVQFKYTMIVVAYSLIVLISLIGNLFVVLVIISKKRTRTTVNIFIANLAFSDLLMTVLNIPFSTARWVMRDWVFGTFLCHVSPFIQATSVYVSTLTMCFIAIDRFRAILQPMRRRISSKVGSSVTIGIIWVIAMIFSLPFLLFSRLVEFPAFGRVYTSCRLVYPQPQERYKKVVNVITFFLQFGIPFTIMVSLYMKIGIRVWSRAAIGATTREQEIRQLQAKKRTILMLLLVAIVFAVCWLPHNTYHFLADFSIIHPDFDYQIAVHWLAMSSVCYNPFIYFWLNRRFQQILRAGMMRLCSSCYVLPHANGCTCCGFTCIFHQMTTDQKLPHVSSPSPHSHSSPRIPGTDSLTSSRNEQERCNLMRYNNRLPHRRRVVSEQYEEHETGFTNNHLMIREVASECTREDYIYSPDDVTSSRRTRGSSRSGRESGRLTSSPVSGRRFATSYNSLLSLNSMCRHPKIMTSEKELTRSGNSSRSLLQHRNHHRQEQMRKTRNPRNQSLLPVLSGKILANHSSGQSLPSSSSTASGLNHHHNHLICYYKGSKHGTCDNSSCPEQHVCHSSRLGRRKRRNSDHDIVLSSL